MAYRGGTGQRPLWAVRPALVGNPSEQGYIIKTWLNGYRHEYGTRDICNDVYYWHHHKLIERLWERPGACWLVACDPEDPSVIYGFLCGERTDTGPVMHWVFTKSKFRRWRIATSLINELIDRSPEGPCVCTHMGRDFLPLARNPNRPWVYNPYVLWYGMETGWQRWEGKKPDDSSPEIIEARDDARAHGA